MKVGAKKDGTLVAWQSQSWGTGGPGGGGMPPIPYCFTAPNQRKEHTAIRNNIGPARAWRAPNHPQAAVLTMCALDDLAAKLNMDPYEFFLKNIELTRLPNVYREEFPIAAELIGWKEKWHPRGQNISGNIARGVGLSLHTWGGRGHASDCDLSIHPDGSVDIKMGTQDIGTGTRTCIAVVAADALGLQVDDIKLYIGDTQYPPSGGSGGSTTPGGVSSSTRRAVVDARDALFAKVAPALNAQPDDLECEGRHDRVKADPATLAELERSLREDRRNAASPSTATTSSRRQEQARPHQQRRRRRADGRSRQSTPKPASSKSTRWSPCRIAA